MNKKVIPAWLLCATFWFALHSGGGFASGQQEVRYYVVNGWTAVVLPFFAMALQGICVFLMWDFARVSKSYDLRSWVDRFYHPFDKIFANVQDAVFIAFLCLPPAAGIAGGSAILEHSFGIPYFPSTIIMTALVFFCAIFGAEVVRRLAGIKTVVLLCLLGAVVAVAIHTKWDAILQHIHMRTVPDDFNWGNTIWMACLYAGFQTTLGPYVSVAESLRTRADCAKAAFTGMLLNGVCLALVCFMLLGYYPEILSKDIPIPVLHIVGLLDQDALRVCYTVAMFFAFIATSFAFVFSSVRRFENAGIWNRLPEGKIPGVRGKHCIIAVLTLLYAFCVSQFGLVAIVSKGYAYMGIFSLFITIIPLLLFGRKKIKGYEERNGAHPLDS